VSNVHFFHREKDDFCISTDPKHVDFDVVLEFLSDAKWWTELTRESLDRALRNSLCFSLMEDGRQIGVARLITDYVTYAYLCDVYIEKTRRRQGLGSWLIRSILEHPEIKNLKRVALITHDAQAFYLGLDFNFASHRNDYMERHR
jgi:GNAT superfamily N-acetyltransferase